MSTELYAQTTRFQEHKFMKIVAMEFMSDEFLCSVKHHIIFNVRTVHPVHAKFKATIIKQK